VAASWVSGLATASTERWDGVSRDAAGLILYLDKASISNAGDATLASVLFDYPDSQLSLDASRAYRSVELRLAIRCGAQEYARASELRYSGSHATGAVVSRHIWTPGERRFRRAAPFTNSQAIVTAVCGTPAAG